MRAQPQQRCTASIAAKAAGLALAIAWGVGLPPLVLAAIRGAPSTTDSAQTTTSAGSAERPATPRLVLDAIEITGNTRTTDATVTERLQLSAGESVDQERLLAAVGALRTSDLFAEIAFHTRPGAQRGHIVLVLEVREIPVEVRLGTGNTDLDGWYLIPAELALDNRLGRGERTSLQVRFGYRHAGVVFSFREPRAGDGSLFWGCEAAALGSDRVYFRDGVEYAQRVDRTRVGAHVGRRLGNRLSVALSMRLETVKVDSTATVRADDETRGVAAGDELPFDRLPGRVAAGVGRNDRSVLGGEIVLDSRGRRQIAGTPASGLWGRLRVEGVLQHLEDARGFGAVDLDLRAYQALLRGALAGRVRAGAVGRSAPFYDRLYLGGLYTVRGFPGQSLSDPGGDTWLWSASLEYRAPLVGPAPRPRLAGVVFLDAGDSGQRGDPDPSDIAASVGYGVRLRVGWFGWLGLDLGMPLSRSPLDESFRAHASIGWSF